MSISNISSLFSSSIIQTVTTPSPQPSGSVDPSGVSLGATVNISKPGQLLGDLSALAQSDPEKFKSVTAAIAKQLKDAASSQTGSSAEHLNKLAERFGAASQSGNVADLTPNARQSEGTHHGHGGHHAHGMRGGAEDSVQQIAQGIISTALEST